MQGARCSENVRVDPGRGENNIMKLRYSARVCGSITENRSVIATTGELASRPITEDRSVIATTGERRNDL